jgi:hypothetical protein
VSDNPNPTEDLGYSFVQRACAHSRSIWRRIAEKDVGLDGLIEFRRRDGASAIVGVQVKSGSSYFRRESSGTVKIALGARLRTLNAYTIPVILVVYDPESDEGYWVHVQAYVSDNPASEDTGQIIVSRQRVFNPAAVEELRGEAKVIQCPTLEHDLVRQFLEFNRGVDLVGFVELAKHVLNGTAFRCRTGIDSIDYLLEHGLLSHRNNPKGGPDYWQPTDLGRKYIMFMLGDRYFIPFILVQPKRPITDDQVTMCMDFEGYLANARRGTQDNWPQTQASLGRPVGGSGGRTGSEVPTPPLPGTAEPQSS